LSINAQDVKLLREKTGAGIMDCKKALLENGGDFNAAVKYLKEKGLAEAKKRSGREAKEGVITVVYTADRDAVLMVEINCETDFVARTDKFTTFVKTTAAALLSKGVDSVERLPEEITNSVKSAIASFGENILIRKLVRFDKLDADKSVFNSYIHLGGKVGVIIEFFIDGAGGEANTEVQECMMNIALQIASMEPVSISQEGFPGDMIDEQREIFMKQAKDTGKPEKILDKIVSGRMAKFFSESCLLEQKYVKDSNVTVNEYLKDREKKADVSIEIKRFARFKLGEE